MNVVDYIKNVFALGGSNEVLTTDEQFSKTIKQYNTHSHFLSNHILSESLIEKYGDKLGWYNVLIYQKLSESFIEKHAEKLDWHYISSNQVLSENFIKKHADKVDWQHISYNQKLSEKFIEDNIDKISLNAITYSQKLSDDFYKKYGITSNILNIVHHCGKFNRSIVIYKHNPDIIYIGCFKGTKEEAIDAIRKKYENDENVMNDYIRKVEECFNF